MKAVLVREDRSLVYGEVADPTVREDEVLIEIAAAAINRADLMQREGNYPPPPGAPEWMGLEVSGIIREMGEVAARESGYRVGDAVCALLGGGGYAEYVSVRYDMLMPVPRGMDIHTAAALPEAFATAYLNLFCEAGAKAGDVFLMQAGASGLASVTIPMAKAFGMRVITTVLSEEKAREIAHLGADIVVDTSKTPLVEVLKAEMEAGRPVDIALDCLGGRSMGECLPYLARGARWIMIATLAGDLTEVDLRNIFVRNVRIIGSTLRSRTPEFKAELLWRLVRDVWPRIEAGELAPTVSAVLPITEAEKGHEMLYSGTSAGKVILTVK